MPGFDGTGPFGYGPGTGRGLGICWFGRGIGRGFGRGFFGGRGFGFGRGFGRGFWGLWRGLPVQWNQEALKGYRRYLEEELKAVDSYLDDSKED